MSSLNLLLGVAETLLSEAKKAGAVQADVALDRSTEFEVKVADGSIGTLTQATTRGLGLRVFVDGKMGFVTASDFQPETLSMLAKRAVAMAHEAAPDEHNGLADVPAGHIDAASLDLYDPAVPALSADQKIAWAHELEKAARAADPRVRKFRESAVATGESDSVLVTSTGAVRSMRSTGISLWSNPIAEENGQLQTELWYDTQTFLADLAPVEEVGRTAGQRAARMLGAKSVPTQEVPVIFEAHMAAGLMAGILGALNGDMVYKKASFLADKLGQPIGVSGLTLYDDPLLKRGSASSPFDGEGLPTAKKALVEGGRLTMFLYDSYTAKKAGAKPTGNARRGYSSMPHPGAFNFYMAAGKDDPQEMLRSVDKALLITRGLGAGVNTVSGEYSRGANGLWIERGEIVHPVQEVTIAGDFLKMLQNIDRIGTDWQMRGSVGAPSIRIDGMMLSGS